MALDTVPQSEGGDTHPKGTFSFLDLLNGPTPLSPQNMGWTEEAEHNLSQENFAFLIGPPAVPASPAYSGVTSNGSPVREHGDRRDSTSFSDTTNSSSMSMPDLHVWGIGDGEDKQDSKISLVTQQQRPVVVGKNKKPSTKIRTNTSSFKSVDRGSDKYKARRERNNISVRKSRAKTKSKIKKIEEHVGRLEHENKHLKLKMIKVRKFLSEFESNFFSWRNILREMEEELSSNTNT